MWISKREYQSLQTQINQYREIIQDLRQSHHSEVQGLREQIETLKDLIRELIKQAYQRPQLGVAPTKELPDQGRWIGDQNQGVYISPEEINALLHGEGMDDEEPSTD